MLAADSHTRSDTRSGTRSDTGLAPPTAYRPALLLAVQAALLSPSTAASTLHTVRLLGLVAAWHLHSPASASAAGASASAAGSTSGVAATLLLDDGTAAIDVLVPRLALRVHNHIIDHNNVHNNDQTLFPDGHFSPLSVRVGSCVQVLACLLHGRVWAHSIRVVSDSALESLFVLQATLPLHPKASDPCHSAMLDFAPQHAALVSDSNSNSNSSSNARSQASQQPFVYASYSDATAAVAAISAISAGSASARASKPAPAYQPSTVHPGAQLAQTAAQDEYDFDDDDDDIGMGMDMDMDAGLDASKAAIESFVLSRAASGGASIQEIVAASASHSTADIVTMLLAELEASVAVYRDGARYFPI